MKEDNDIQCTSVKHFIRPVYTVYTVLDIGHRLSLRKVDKFCCAADVLYAYAECNSAMITEIERHGKSAI